MTSAVGLIHVSCTHSIKHWIPQMQVCSECQPQSINTAYTQLSQPAPLAVETSYAAMFKYLEAHHDGLQVMLFECLTIYARAALAHHLLCAHTIMLAQSVDVYMPSFCCRQLGN